MHTYKSRVYLSTESTKSNSKSPDTDEGSLEAKPSPRMRGQTLPLSMTPSKLQSMAQTPNLSHPCSRSGLGGSYSNLCGLFCDASSSSQVRRFMSCTVGRKPTHAKYYLDDVEDVTELLMAFKTSGRKRIPWSASDTLPADFRSRSKGIGIESILPE